MMKLTKEYLKYCQQSDSLFKQLEKLELPIGEKEEIDQLILENHLVEAERRMFSHS
jgi:hypothetical protein